MTTASASSHSARKEHTSKGRDLLQARTLVLSFVVLATVHVQKGDWNRLASILIERWHAEVLHSAARS